MTKQLSWMLAILTASLASTGWADEVERPNIVVFLSDDHTRTDSSLYGSTDLKTPQMERLAAAGMTFDNAFVASPSCAPSRAAMLTGLMPARNGAEPNHSRPRAEIKKLPKYLQELGYEVVSFGKVGHYGQTPEYGFDLARHYGYHEDIAIEKALEWLNARESTKSLCLFVGTNWPHVPWPKAESIDPESIEFPPNHVVTPETRAARAKYYQAVRTMDNELGKVFDAAYEKLGQNTLFVHTSDHGAQWPFGKWNLYDAGIRTPMIVAWPGKIEQGTRTQAMVSWVDLLPTLVDAAGGEPDSKLDGRSILPVLTGEKDEHREAIFTTHSGDGNFNVFPSRSMRDRQFKYILNLHPNFEFRSHVTERPREENYWASWVRKAETDEAAAEKVDRYLHRPAEELYDLAADPYERHNLAEMPEHAERLARMRTELRAWMKEQGDTETVFGMPRLWAAPNADVGSNLPQRPNVVMVFIDDMGWADLSCFGGTAVETTHIDRLANEGLRFTNFYVNSPICSPSRTALTTGHYPARHRITSFLAHRKLNAERGMDQWLDVESVTLPRLLTAQGYACGHFGKWHLGGQRDVGEAPLITEYGFDASLTNFEGLGPRVLPLCDAFDGSRVKKHDLGSAALGRGPIEWEDRSKITGRFVDSAIAFIDQAQAAGKPFYINLWPDDVHSPFFPPEALRGENTKQALYHGVLKAMDDQLGALFDRIRKDERLSKNTIILLASDNGPEIGAGSAGPLRGSKGQLYEGGIRSPLIVWAPAFHNDNVKGTKNETTILSSIDLVRSLMTLTGAEPPEGYESDGEDLAAVLLGLSQAQRGGPLFWRRPPDRPGPADDRWPDLAVRDQQWKLVCEIDGSNPRLYNLENDIGESRNVSKTHPRITNRLKTAVLEWNATLPVDAVAGPVAVE